MIRIVVTGAECTGKTTLVRALGQAFGAPWVPEAARLFVEREGRAVRTEDVAAIAALHGELAAAAEADGPDLVLYDTDLLSTVAYARHYFGSCPPAIEREARRRAADLYLLAGTDIPWRPEVDQRGDETGREAVQDLIRDLLRTVDATVVDVAGTAGRRLQTARRAIEELLSGG